MAYRSFEELEVYKASREFRKKKSGDSNKPSQLNQLNHREATVCVSPRVSAVKSKKRGEINRRPTQTSADKKG